MFLLRFFVVLLNRFCSSFNVHVRWFRCTGHVSGSRAVVQVLWFRALVQVFWCRCSGSRALVNVISLRYSLRFGRSGAGANPNPQVRIRDSGRSIWFRCFYSGVLVHLPSSGLWWLFRGYFTIISRRFHDGFTVISRLFYGYFTVTSRWSLASGFILAR